MAAAAITLVGQSLFKVLLANRWGGALHRDTRSGSYGRGHLFEEVEGRKEDDSGLGNQGTGQPERGCAHVWEGFKLDYLVTQQT